MNQTYHPLSQAVGQSGKFGGAIAGILEESLGQGRGGSIADLLAGVAGNLVDASLEVGRGEYRNTKAERAGKNFADKGLQAMGTEKKSE